MAKKITITGDASQLRQEFNQTAKEIDESLGKLGTKTQDLTLTSRQRAEYLKQEARNTGIVGSGGGAGAQVRDARRNVANYERELQENRNEYNAGYKEITGDKSIPDKRKKELLFNLQQDTGDREDEIKAKLKPEQERLESAEAVSKGLLELEKQLKLQDVQQRSRHNEWVTLTRKELDVKAKEIDAALSKEIDSDKLEELKADRVKIRELQNGKGQEEKKSDPLESLRQAAIWGYMGRGAQTIGNAVGDTTGQAVGIANNSVGAMAAEGFNIPGAALAGGAVAGLGIIGLMLQKGKELEQARDQLSGMSGYGREKDFGRTDQATSLGYDQAEFITQAGIVAKSRGSANNLYGNTIKQIEMRKGLGLDDGDLGGLNSMSTVGVNNTEHAVEKLLGVLSRSALVNLSAEKFDVSSLPHYLERLTQLNQRSIEKTGRANNDTNTDIMATIMGIGGGKGIFSDYRTAGSAIQGLQEGFNNPGDDARKYYNSQAIAAAHPGMQGNPLAMEKLMESPDAKSMVELVNQTIKRGRAYAGNGAQGDWQVAGMLKDIGFGTWAKAEEVMKAGGITEKQAKELNVDLSGRAVQNSGALDKTNAQLTNKLNQPGEGMIMAMAKLFQAMQGGATLGDVANAVKAIPNGGYKVQPVKEKPEHHWWSSDPEPPKGKRPQYSANKP
jgi:hypothetical protein